MEGNTLLFLTVNEVQQPRKFENYINSLEPINKIIYKKNIYISELHQRHWFYGNERVKITSCHKILQGTQWIEIINEALDSIFTAITNQFCQTGMVF